MEKPARSTNARCRRLCREQLLGGGEQKRPAMNNNKLRHRRNVTRYHFFHYINFFGYYHKVGEVGEVSSVKSSLDIITQQGHISQVSANAEWPASLLERLVNSYWEEESKEGLPVFYQTDMWGEKQDRVIESYVRIIILTSFEWIVAWAMYGTNMPGGMVTPLLVFPPKYNNIKTVQISLRQIRCDGNNRDEKFVKCF